MPSPPLTTDDTNGELAFASQRQLVWWRFKRHRLALVGAVVVLIIYLLAAFCEFWAPHTQDSLKAVNAYAPPQLVRVAFDGGVQLSTYGYSSTPDPKTLTRTFALDRNDRIPLRFLPRGDEYKLWGLFETDRHFFGPADKADRLYLIGADDQGRDLLSRLIYGSRISMSVGLIGVLIAFVLGVLLGGVSGYFGGTVDNLVQRIIEFFISIPTLPLWLGLAAAVPPGWGPLKSYFAITLILSLIGWTGLARVVRSRFLQIRGEDYVLAAQLDGVPQLRIIGRHMLPAFTSHIIASLTLAIPAMILGETALSFLGLGLQPPVVSWGVLLNEAQNLRALATAPWLLFPGLAVVVSVVALNFVGDGMRDAADPYGR